MSYYSRQQEIIDYLKEHKQARVSELARDLFCSEATIRRDLSKLEFDRLIKRTHGAAILSDKQEEVSATIRETENAMAKEKIGRIAFMHCPIFRSIFIDNSSTALFFLKTLDLSNKIVVSNGVIALRNASANPKCEAYALGGRLRADILELTGSKALEDLNNYHFDLAVVSCASILEKATYETSENTAAIKKRALENSKFKVLLVDKAKVGRGALFKTMNLEAYDMIVTDAKNDELEPFMTMKNNIIKQ